MKKIFLLFSLLLSNHLYSQNYDLNGVWEGKLFQSAGGISKEYNFRFIFKQTGNFISGSSRINLFDNPKIFSKMDLVGSIDGDNFLFQETKILDQRLLPNMVWCIKHGSLKITIIKDRISLSGNWKDNKGECSPGSIEVSKPFIQPIKQTRTLLIKGVVKDKQFTPLKAILTLKSDNKLISEAKTNTENGFYKIVIQPKNKKYVIEVMAKGYFPIHYNLVVDEITTTIIKNFELIPLEKGVNIRLNNVLFVQGQDDLLEESFPELNNLVNVLKENMEMRIRLEGHTDFIGNPDDNMKLSENRVKKIKNYLIKNSIAENRIELAAFGGSKPIKKDGTDEERKVNRRVEFVIL